MDDALNAKPAHYRLSRATWEIILEAYRNGATVPELSERWRVSQHALRKRITVHGATKRDWGDARAREQAEARERMQAERTRGRGEVTLDDIPLELIKALALNEDQCASSRLAIWDEADPHPAKQEYWAVNAAQHEAGMEEWLALMRERKTLRDRVRELEAAAGLDPRSDQARVGRAKDEQSFI